MNRNHNLLCCLIFFVVGIFLSIYFYSKPIHDYGNYYYGSRFVMEGKSVSDIYEPYKFNLDVREVPEMHSEKFLLNYTVVPPCTLFFYMPFTGLEVHLSKFLFNLISILIFCFFLFRLLKFLNVQSNYVLLIPVLLIIPFRNNLLFGQAYLLLTGLMMGGFVAETKNKNLPAAIYYSLAIVLKISPAILLIYLLVRKKIKLFLITIIVSAILFFSAIFLTGWQLMHDYIFHFIPKMMQNEINNPFATTYQSTTVFLRNLFVHDRLLNPDAMTDSPLAFSILTGICTGILFFLLIRKIKNATTEFEAFSFILFGSLALSAYTSSYSMIFMIPLCIHSIANRSKSFLLILFLIFLTANIPVNFLQSLPVLLRFPRLYLMLALFLILTLHPKIVSSDLKWVVACILFFVTTSMITSRKNDDNSEYFLTVDAGLLSYNFDVSGNKLLLKTLYEDGSREKEFVLVDSAATSKPLSLVDGQIFYNNFHTTGNDKKLNPLLINNDFILYLSDKDRGIGFYTLRKISINH